MTPALNREALRKEAEVVVGKQGDLVPEDPSNLGWALTVLSLLAELERVERDLELARSAISGAVENVENAYAARLAVIPGLVESLREVVHDAALASDVFWLERVVTALSVLESK